jgi:hypothetical protein
MLLQFKFMRKPAVFLRLGLKCNGKAGVGQEKRGNPCSKSKCFSLQYLRLILLSAQSAPCSREVDWLSVLT